MKHRDRLRRMLPDKEEFIQSIRDTREGDYQVSRHHKYPPECAARPRYWSSSPCYYITIRNCVLCGSLLAAMISSSTFLIDTYSKAVGASCCTQWGLPVDWIII